MRVSAKVDYALRAMLELASADDGHLKGERIAQAIALKFLENILLELRRQGQAFAPRPREHSRPLAGSSQLATMVG